MNEQRPSETECDAVDFESRPADPSPPVEVHIAKYAMPQTVTPVPPLERKRAGIWRNDHRNLALAAIARGFAHRELAQLWQHSLWFDPAATGALLQLPCSPGVVIVVESIEHVTELFQLLPDFGVAAARVIEAPPSKTLRGIPVNWIRTMIAVDQSESVSTDVLINAVGGPHALNVPAWRFDNARGGIMIDFADEWDDQAARETEIRLATYSRRVRRLVGADAVLGRDLTVPFGLPKKSSDQRLAERLAGVDRTRRLNRLEGYRNWRSKRASK